MSQENYLKARLISISSENQHFEARETLNLVLNREDIQHLECSPSLKAAAGEAFNHEEIKIFPFYGDHLKLEVMIPQQSPENLRLAGAQVFASLKKENCLEITVSEAPGLSPEEKYAFLEGILLSSYAFDKYKTKKSHAPVSIHCSADFISETSLTELQNIAEAVALTKNLVNEPSQNMNAVHFSECVVQAGKKYGFTTQILQKSDIEDLKMGGLLAVNRGSAVPPTFSMMHYKPENARNRQPLILVGKGVTFDTGGYSLKVGGNMTSMKSDMAGGAAVLGIISAAASNHLPYHIIGLVPATDNKISSDALVVDDIITMMDGTTVEVQNTDAEGRLVLADALAYAKRHQPELVIDMATLTGASAAITGPFGIAMAGNTEEWMADLKVSGENTYERLVQLPFWKEFTDLLKSDIADLKNIGGPVGGGSTAGKFLEHFTDYPWIHLDIAGAAFINDAKGYRQSGATGVAVRLVYDFIKRKCD